MEGNKNWLWYLRFGHLNFISLNQLISQGVVIGFQSFKMPNKIYDGYIVGKQLRILFKNNLPIRRNNVIEVVHSDMWVHFDEKSLEGNKYLISLVDEHRRKL